MRSDKDYTPTPQELNKAVSTMTVSQKLQLNAIIDMITALLVSVQQVQTTKFHEQEN